MAPIGVSPVRESLNLATGVFNLLCGPWPPVYGYGRELSDAEKMFVPTPQKSKQKACQNRDSKKKSCQPLLSVLQPVLSPSLTKNSLFAILSPPVSKSLFSRVPFNQPGILKQRSISDFKPGPGFRMEHRSMDEDKLNHAEATSLQIRQVLTRSEDRFFCVA